MILAAPPLAMATLLCIFRPFDLQFPNAGLDPAWAMVLGEAADHPARWGVDLVFTYGPVSALVTRYFTDRYFEAIFPIAAGSSLVMGLCAACLIVGATAGRRRGLLLAVLCVATLVTGLLSNAMLDPDGLCFSFALIVFLLDHEVVRTPLPTLRHQALEAQRPASSRLTRVAVLLGAADLGVLAVCKTSYGIAALLLLVLADARALRRRRVPLLIPAFLAAFLLTFLAFGQRLGDLPAYLHLQSQVVVGYGDAIYVAGSRRELALFVGLAAALAGAVAASELRARAPWIHRLTTVLAVIILLLIGFKAGFVRQDTHPQIAWGVLGFSGLSVAFALFLPRSLVAGTLVGGLSLLVLGVLAPLTFLKETEQPVDLAGLTRTYADWIDGTRQEAGHLWRFIADPGGVLTAAKAAKAEALRRVRDENPLPRLDGTVDMLASNQGVLLANGLDYHPRPSFAEYSTYTQDLIDANRTFFAGSGAPQWMLFRLDGLDGRFLAMSEGEIWPDLLRRYEPVRTAGDDLALRRRAVDLPDRLGPATSDRARLGEPYRLATSGPVFARIDVRKTWLGRLMAAAFRPPALTIEVKLVTGEGFGYRFIPALGAGGFVLSPLIRDPLEFAALDFGLMSPLKDKAVVEFVIGGTRLARLCYDPDIRVELRPIRAGDAPPSADAQALYDTLASRPGP